MATNRPQREGLGDGYEHRDANIPALLKLGLGLAVLIAVTLVAMKWTFDIFDKVQPLGPPAAPFISAEARQLPPGPRVQAAPHLDLKDYCSAQQSNVQTYAWIDQKQGTVRIPVDRAMDMILQQGLPTRASSGAATTDANGTVANGGSSSGANAATLPGTMVGAQNTQAASYLNGPCGYLTEGDVTPPSE